MSVITDSLLLSPEFMKPATFLSHSFVIISRNLQEVQQKCFQFEEEIIILRATWKFGVRLKHNSAHGFSWPPLCYRQSKIHAMSLVSPTPLHVWLLSWLSGSAPACKLSLFLGTSSLQQVKTTKMPQTLTTENVCPSFPLEVLFYGDVLSPSLNVRCGITVVPSSINNSPGRYGAAKRSVKERGLAPGISFFTV